MDKTAVLRRVDVMADKAQIASTNQRRRNVVDLLDRQGFTPITIAEYFARSDKEEITELVPGTPNGQSTLNERVAYITRKFLRADLNIIHRRRVFDIDQTTAEDALREYIAREERIYTQAWRDHDIASDVSDRLKALLVARDSARNKAKALNAVLEHKTAQPLNILNLGQLAIMAGQEAPEQIVEAEAQLVAELSSG